MGQTAKETILVPLNRSSESEAALPYAVTIAKALGASVHLVSVIEAGTDYPFVTDDRHRSAIVERSRRSAGSYLADKAAILKTEGLEASTALAVGNAAEAILLDAEQTGASMIIMATHSRGGLERWVLGSVADKVMRMARIPTMLVHPSKQRGSVEQVNLHTLLVPLDGSAWAEAAITPAVRLARATGAKLLLLRIEPWVNTPADTGSEGPWEALQAEMERDAEKLARDYITSMQSRLLPDVECEGIVERGNVTPMLESIIGERTVDLVVMTTHGRGGLARLVLGSNADRLVRAGIPAMLIRPALAESKATQGATEGALVQ